MKRREVLTGLLAAPVLQMDIEPPTLVNPDTFDDSFVTAMQFDPVFHTLTAIMDDGEEIEINLSDLEK